MTAYYDEFETRDGQAREEALFAALPRHIAHAKASAPYFATLFADVDAPAIRDRKALARLPLTRKSDLIARQADDRPFGGLAAAAAGGMARIFQSPGPIYEPMGKAENFYRVARGLFAAGFRPGDLAINCFSYHLTPGGFMLDSGARALGCAVIPGGVGNTEQQLDVIADLRPQAYCGTPSFLKILLDKAAETGRDASSIVKAQVSGEYFPPALQQAWASRGLDAYQCYATAELGLIAYETEARQGMVVEEGLIVEIVRPGTGDPLPPGEVGEVVVTLPGGDYPLIRFATGDLSAVLEGPSPCGRTNMRLKGWMGRADQTTKVKGMFVHPEQVAKIAGRHPGIAKARLVVESVDGKDTMTLHCESESADAALEAAVGATLQTLTKLRGAVVLVAPGTLANDGLVIEDKRSYE